MRELLERRFSALFRVQKKRNANSGDQDRAGNSRLSSFRSRISLFGPGISSSGRRRQNERGRLAPDSIENVLA